MIILAKENSAPPENFEAKITELQVIEPSKEIRRLPDTKTVFLGGIFIIMFLTVLRIGSVVVLPIVMAIILKLVLQPILRILCRVKMPRTIASFLIVSLLVGSLVGLGTLLSGPVASWGERLPGTLSQLRSRLDFITKPVEKTQKILTKAENLTIGGAPAPKTVPVIVEGDKLSDKVFYSTQMFASSFFTTMVMLFFLLASGDIFLRRLVEVLPRFEDKRQAVLISEKIELDISAYLLTITIMNALVGVATGFTMAAHGMQDPILWGTLAFLLNFIPVVGPAIGFVCFLLGGLVTIDNIWVAVLPSVLYLVIHWLESMIITPIVVAKRFSLNPVVVIFSLIFWYWMWGVAGAIISMPILAIIKIICDRLPKFAILGHFLEGETGKHIQGVRGLK